MHTKYVKIYVAMSLQMCNYYVWSIPALRVLSHFFLQLSLSYLAMVLGLSGSTQSIHVYTEYYRSLVKECSWVEHLTSLAKRGVGALSSVLHLTTKDSPCHVYSNLMPLKQIIEQTIMYNGAISTFEVMS